MKLVYILLGLFITINSFSQGFNKVVEVENTNGLGDNIMTLEDGFLIARNANILDSVSGVLTFVKTNFQGELQWQRVYDSLRVVTDGAILLDDENLVVTCFAKEDTIDRIRLLKMDLDGNILISKKIGSEVENEAPSQLTKTTTGYALSHLVYNTEGYSSWIQFYDEELNLNNEVFFHEDGPYYLPGLGDLIGASNGDVLAVTEVGGDPQYAYVTRISNTGEVIWTMISHETGYFSPGSYIIPLDDNNFAFGWHRDTNDIHLYRYPPAVYGMDSEGHFTWEHVFYSSDTTDKYINHLFLAENGDIVGSGFYWAPVFEGEDPSQCGWIFRLSPQGELLWERTICDFTSPVPGRAFQGGDNAPNGSLVFTGVHRDTFSLPDGTLINIAKIWLVRTDSMGCVQSECEELQVFTDTREAPSLQPPKQLTVFPNPANNVLRLRWEGQAPANEPTFFQLYNTHGQLVFEQALPRLFPDQVEEIDISGLPTGIYAYGVLGESGIVVKR